MKVFPLILLVFTASVGSAQTYSIDWYTIDAGGGTSTGGVYSVNGTIGQTDSGAQSGEPYSLTGGFWSLLSLVQAPAGPLLSITLTPTNTAIVSWPSPSTGFVLQQNSNGLGSLHWSDVAVVPTDNGTIKYVLVTPATGGSFYRLFKP
jgi:hypothetical protein